MRIKKLLIAPLGCLILATSCICVDWKDHTKGFCIGRGQVNLTLPSISTFPPPPADDFPNEDSD